MGVRVRIRVKVRVSENPPSLLRRGLLSLLLALARGPLVRVRGRV